MKRILQSLFKRIHAPIETLKNNDKYELLATAKHLYDASQWQQAHEKCSTLLAIWPADLDGLKLAFDIALRRSDFVDVIDWLKIGVHHYPSNAELHFMCGYILVEAGQLTEAPNFLQEAIRLDSRMAKAFNSLGVVFQRFGRLDEALQYFQSAQSIDPTFWRASYNIGNICKLTGRFEDSVEPFQDALKQRRGIDVVDTRIDREKSITTLSKLTHDMEQLTFLVENGIVEKQQGMNAIDGLNQLLSLMVPGQVPQMLEIPSSVKPVVAPYYNKLTHFYNAPAIPGGALNQDQDWAAIEATYFANSPGMAYMDNFLKPEALASLRRFCLESTIWFDFLYGGGYVGCTCEDGFICPLLVQIAEEQRRALPSIFKENHIGGLWAYKYDSEQTGIATHADFAAINVNFWITPDEANLDPTSGGLVIWDKEAPLDWDFQDYNANEERISQFLREKNAKQYIVPYRQNRVVLFNSDLFHRTDNYRFKPGYENRRINVTMLYGDRQTS